MKKEKKAYKKIIKVPIMCKREGCTNIIGGDKRSWCSNVCKNRAHMIAKGKGDVLAVYDWIGQVKYDKAYSTTKLQEYFELCERDDKNEILTTPKGGIVIIRNARPPLLEDYACFINFSVNTLNSWIRDIPEFAFAMDMLKQKQKAMLIRRGLSGQYATRITELQLMNNHGMHVKIDNENTHKFSGIMKHIYEKADQLEKAGKVLDAEVKPKKLSHGGN